MMIDIDLDTPSDNCSRRFRSRRQIFMKFTKLFTAQDEECPKVLFYV